MIFIKKRTKGFYFLQKIFKNLLVLFLFKAIFEENWNSSFLSLYELTKGNKVMAVKSSLKIIAKVVYKKLFLEYGKFSCNKKGEVSTRER